MRLFEGTNTCSWGNNLRSCCISKRREGPHATSVFGACKKDNLRIAEGSLTWIKQSMESRLKLLLLPAKYGGFHDRGE